MGGAIATSPAAVAAASDVVILLDCPISGTGDQARSGDVVVFASGDQQAVDYCVPVFEAFARSHHCLSEFGVGSKMKFGANLLVAVHNVAAAEALMLARAAAKPLLGQTISLYDEAVAAGDGELDSAAVFRRYLKAAGEQA